MAVFANRDELLLCLGTLFDAAKCDERIAPRIKDSGLIIQFRYENPAAVVTIDTSRPPTQPGAYFDVIWDSPQPPRPDVEMSMQADIAHQFWHGQINLMAALTRRQIVARGPIPKILKLLPVVTPMYDMYPGILRRLGRPDLILGAR